MKIKRLGNIDIVQVFVRGIGAICVVCGILIVVYYGLTGQLSVGCE